MNYNFQVGKLLVHYIISRKLACALQISKQCPTCELSAFVLSSFAWEDACTHHFPLVCVLCQPVCHSYTSVRFLRNI